MLSSRHIISMDDLTTEDIFAVLDTAESRTRTSFEIAAKRLSADAVNFSASSSATVKGESLRDTAATLAAMSCDLVVVRHKYAGSPRMLADEMDCSIVNGGDGMHEHPTQALLDLYTMRQHLGRLEGLTVGIVGDICHSRVAGSLVPALRKVGARPIVIAPPTLLPSRPDVLGAEVSWDLDEVLPTLDVAYMLRIQMERAEGMPFPSVREYARLYGMNSARLAKLPAKAIVMHPGPMNRGVEISADVADGERSVVLGQVESGVAVRMAVMYLLLGGADSGAAA
jgi:aspartate carbamoyltransferase catalytic subunit